MSWQKLRGEKATEKQQAGATFSGAVRGAETALGTFNNLLADSVLNALMCTCVKATPDVFSQIIMKIELI